MTVHALSVRVLPILKMALAKIVLITASHVLRANHAINVWITTLILMMNASYAAKQYHIAQYAHLIKYVRLAQILISLNQVNARVVPSYSTTVTNAIKKDAKAVKGIMSLRAVNAKKLHHLPLLLLLESLVGLQFWH